MARTQVQSELIATNAISGTIIADNAITATHIATNAISGTLVQDSGITTTMIASNNVTAAKIVSDGIETRHLHSNVISGLSAVTPVAGDYLLAGDTSDSNNLKKILVSGITGLVDITTKANIASPSFTGTVTITGASSAYNTLQITSNSTGHGAIINLGDTSDADYGSITQFASSAGEGGRMRFIAGTTETMNLRGGKVGIGVSSPDAPLHINGSANSEQVIITGNTNANRGLSIQTAASGGQQDAGVVFDAQDTENGANPYHAFETAGTERIRFNSSGHIAVGHTSPNVISSTAPTLSMNNPNSSTLSGGISYSANGTIKAYHYFENDFLLHQTAAGVGHKWYDGTGVGMRLDGDGLKFGTDSAAANALDDYEEGTFTPTFSGATLATDDGSYTKIGNQVTVHFRVITTGGLPTSSSQVQVGNLPFTIGTGFGGVGGLYVGPSNVSSATGGGGTIVAYVTGGETVIRFLNVDTGTYGYTTWGELEVSHNNAVTAIGTVTYTI